METFAVGDKAVYPAHGVAEVVALEKREIGGSSMGVFILEILDTGLTIMVPTANADAVGLRKIITDDEAAEVYEILRSKEVTKDTQTWNRRYREYMEKIKTGSAHEIAEVLRDLSLLRQHKDLSFGERRMLENARGLLVKELALAKETSEDAVSAELDEIFATDEEAA